jgi:hypothetical protein
MEISIMVRRFTFTALAVSFGLVAGACSEQADPTSANDAGFTGVTSTSDARATTFTDNMKFPVNILVFVSCADGGAGELVVLSGNLHSLFHSTINDNNWKMKIHNQPQGISGVGLTTGDKYQGTGVTQETVGGSFVNGQFSRTVVNNFRIIGQGRGNNYLLHATTHFTLNANGELTAFVDNFSAECK